MVFLEHTKVNCKIMFIKIEPKSETQKAYQLQNGSWIPKSILDGRGLKHPYYQIKNWWLSITIEKLIEENDKSSEHVVLGIKPMVVRMVDIPEDIRDCWSKYWKKASDSLHQSYYEMEPRLWGNDCFKGEMSSWF
jgi:hypothetical protein